MRGGRKAVASRLFFETLNRIRVRTQRDAMEVLLEAVDVLGPLVETRARHVAGVRYERPEPVSPQRRVTLAIRSLVASMRRRQGAPSSRKLADAILDALTKRGIRMPRQPWELQ
jgi:small subunit ribosomal protein S7